jgi:hypothetical protein
MLGKQAVPIPLVLACALGVSLLAGCFGGGDAMAATAGWDLTGAQPSSARSSSGAAPVHGVVDAAGARVTMAPVGLSLEYPVMARDLGSGACPSGALASELLRLGSPPIALGGQSQDFTVPSGVPSGPPSSWQAITSFVLPASFWGQLHCLLSAAHDPLTVGINAKVGQLSWAAQMVAGAQSAATNGLDFSLGNEPDLYYLPNYSSLAKPQSGEEAAAVNLYLRVASNLQQAVGHAAVLGPELATAEHWRSQLPRVLLHLGERTVGVHMYPLTTCASPRAVTVAGLLSAQAADAPRRLAWVVADANRAGVPAIISEANSAACGGKQGVSDTPAAAVWAVRFVLTALKTGFREVRFHFSGDPYDPFLVRGNEVIGRPLESALVALNRWLPVGASLRTVAGMRGLATTAVSGGRGVRLILDNESPSAQSLLVHTVQSLHSEELSAAGAGLRAHTFRPSHGAVKLNVEGNSVLAVLAAP